MKAIKLFTIVAVIFLSSGSFAQSDLYDPPSATLIDFQVVPSDYTSTPGTGTFLGPLANTQRTYQLLIHQDLLTSLVGLDLQAISWRIPTSATANWPLTEVIFTSYDIYLSGSVTPSDRSLTFINNVVGPQKLVRSGGLTIPTDSYPFGGTPVNGWGREIAFDSIYLYTGGHLLVEIRHTGFTGTSRSLDALLTSTAGYLTLFSACWTGNYTGVTGTQGNFSILRLTADDPIPVELTSFTAITFGSNVELKWSTASETNNRGFEVERKHVGNEEWNLIGFVTGNGTTTEAKSYSLIDRNLSTGNYQYRLKQLDYDGSFEYSNVVEVSFMKPNEYSLEQNYPNPFNPVTNINFSIAEQGLVKLAVYDLLGQEVISLINEFREAGPHSISFDASSFPSGTYFYKIETGTFSETKKMLMLK